MNVSSIAVKTVPEHMEEVIEKINSLDFCEVHFNDGEGQVVVTIEGDSISEQMKSLSLIQDIPNVLTANLAFSYCEEETTEAMERMKRI